MMRLYLSSVLVLTAVSLLWSQSSDVAFKWYSLGLEDVKVNCILADDTSTILAGTDNGIMVWFNNKWYRATSGLPVNALARVSGNRIAAAIGNGSKSDGIYLGVGNIKGPPFYSFELLFWMTKPEALTVSELKLDTLYAGSSEAICRFALSNQTDPSVVKPEIIKLPPYAFGVESPSCKAIEIFSGWLVAGGNDRSPMPGLGHLLYNMKDSMHVERTMNVTAMTVYNTGGFAGRTVLAVGTKDSGVYVGRIVGPTMPPVQPWDRFDSPNKEPVNAITAVHNLKAEGIGMPVVAVKSGVYINGISISAEKWTKIGSIPDAPLCLAFHGNGNVDYTVVSYLAGTENGVYRYGPGPSTEALPAGGNGNASDVSLSVMAGNGGTRIAFTSVKAGGAEVAVHGISGRVVCKRSVRLNAGVNSITLPVDNYGRGIYLLSIRGDGFAPLSWTVTLGR